MPDEEAQKNAAPRAFNPTEEARKAAEKVEGARPDADAPDTRSDWERQADLIREMNRKDAAEKAREASAARRDWNTVDDSSYVPARILWPALGFPAVIAPGGNDPAVAARTICLLVVSARDPRHAPLSKREVARHLRIVPWDQRRERRHLPAGGAESFKEEEIEVRDTESFLDDGRAQLVNLGGIRSLEDPEGEHGFVVGLSTWVRDFYANKLPENKRLPFLYEIRILEHAMARFSQPLYHLFWVNKHKGDDKQVRSEELHVLIEHHARPSRFGKDGVLTLDNFVGKTREAYERRHLNEYEFEFGKPETADHRTEVLHPVFIRQPKPQLQIGHLTDLHMDIRVEVLDQKLSRNGARIHNWNKACTELYDNAKNDCDVLLMTGDLIDYGRGYNGTGPMNSDTSYWRDRNWFIFYTFLASSANYAKPVYTSLGNHDWRVNPYPVLNESAPKPHELGAQSSEVEKAYGPNADAKTYSTDPAMFVEGLGKLLFDRDGGFAISRTALVTTPTSVAWYMLLINPFLDYTCRLPGGYNLVMLDWAKDEDVDLPNILGGKVHARGAVPDNYGGPLARNCLTPVQKALVEHVAAAPGSARIMGIHQPVIGPHEHWTDDELVSGRVRYTTNDLKAAADHFNVHRRFRRVYEGTDHQRKDSLHRLRGATFDRALLDAVSTKGASSPGWEYPTLAIRTTPNEPLGREADCGSFAKDSEREWLVRKLRQANFSLVLAGHIHRRHVLVIDDSGKNVPPEWRGKWIVRTMPSGRAPRGFGPVFVNSTSAGPRGHVYPSRGKYRSADSGYSYISIASTGAIDVIEFRPERDLDPKEVIKKPTPRAKAVRSPSPWIDEGAPIGVK